MTAIAGFRSFGIPVLIGDFFREASGEHGIRKRLVILSDRCAVAWTGDPLAAASVIKNIQSATNGDLITMESISAILTEPAMSSAELPSTKLIGWVVDGLGQHCFSWHSLYPDTIVPGAPAFDGSGVASIQQLVGNVGMAHDESVEAPDPALPALQITTRLMSDELLNSASAELGFGSAYEIAFVKNQRFQYADNILYLAITCELDQTGSYTGSSFVGSLYKYRVHETFTQIFVYNPATHVQERHVVEPVGLYSRQSGDEGERSRVFPWDSDYYCVFLYVSAPGFSKTITFVFDRSSSEELVDTSNPGAFSFNVPPHIIEWMTRQFLRFRNNRARRSGV